jgi:hypothetical protein
MGNRKGMTKKYGDTENDVVKRLAYRKNSAKAEKPNRPEPKP